MSRFPQGLLPFGDAIASFNPIYGQGMTVAAMNALALCESLRHGEDGLPRRFLRASAKVVDGAWQMAAGSDLAFPEVRGPCSPRMRLNSFYTERVLAAAETDPFVAERFIRAVGFVDPPTALLHPAVLRRVWAVNRPRRADGKVASGTETSPSHPECCGREPAVQPVDAIVCALPSCVGCRKFAPIGVPSALVRESR